MRILRSILTLGVTIALAGSAAAQSPIVVTIGDDDGFGMIRLRVQVGNLAP